MQYILSQRVHSIAAFPLFLSIVFEHAVQLRQFTLLRLRFFAGTDFYASISISSFRLCWAPDGPGNSDVVTASAHCSAGCSFWIWKPDGPGVSVVMTEGAVAATVWRIRPAFTWGFFFPLGLLLSVVPRFTLRSPMSVSITTVQLTQLQPTTRY